MAAEDYKKLLADKEKRKSTYKKYASSNVDPTKAVAMSKGLLSRAPSIQIEESFTIPDHDEFLSILSNLSN